MKRWRCVGEINLISGGLWSEIDSQSVLVPMVQARPVVGQVACLHIDHSSAANQRPVLPLCWPMRGSHCLTPEYGGPGPGLLRGHWWNSLRAPGACHYRPIRGRELVTSANERLASGLPNTPATSHARPISHKQTSMTRHEHDTPADWLKIFWENIKNQFTFIGLWKIIMA